MSGWCERRRSGAGALWRSTRSSFDYGRNVELDIMARHIGQLPKPIVFGYTAVDARLG